MGRLSEEEYLIIYDKYSSNMYSNDQSGLPWSSSDRDVHHEHTRKRGTQKYLRESYYNRIECTVATFLGIYVEKTFEQCYLGYHNSQKAK